jgi:excisionase family DNA binding protein
VIRENLTPPWYEDLPDMVTPEQAQAFLQVGRNTMYDLLKTDQIKSVKFGRLIRIPKTADGGQAVSTMEPTRIDRYETIVALLRQILDRLDLLEEDMDAIDRFLKPYGDGSRRPRRRTTWQ